MQFLGGDIRLGGSAGPSAFKPRVNSQASASSLTPDISSYDAFELTALAANITVNSPTGTPYNFQRITFRFVDNGTARSIAWGPAFRRLSTTGLPATTTINKVVTIIFEYQSTLAVWVCVDSMLSNALAGNISFIGGQEWFFAGSTSGTNTLTLTDYFTGGLALQAGDVLVLGNAILGSGHSSDYVTSSGWTDATGSIFGDDTADTYLRGYVKAMGSSPDTTITINNSGDTNYGFGCMVRAYRGVDITTPLDVTTATNGGANTYKPNPPSNTPATPGAMHVVMGCGFVNADTAFSSSDLNNFLEDCSPSWGGGLLPVGHGHLASTGITAFDPASFTAALGNNAAWSNASFNLVLRSS